MYNELNLRNFINIFVKFCIQYIHTYICAHIHTHAHTYIYIYMYTHINTHTNRHTHFLGSSPVRTGMNMKLFKKITLVVMHNLIAIENIHSYHKVLQYKVQIITIIRIKTYFITYK